MKFRQNPLSSVVIALAVWACLLPLGDLIDREAFLLESLPIVGISAVIGLVLSLLHAPRILILLAQTVGLAGVVVWRGLSLAGPGDALGALRLLTSDGVEAIRTQAPPLAAVPGLIWLVLLLSALLVLVVELLVNGLEQPGWSIAPLSLPFVLSALIVRQDLGFLDVLPVVGGYLLILLVSSGTGRGAATGRASRQGSYQASRYATAAVMAAIAVVAALVLAPLIPLGQKQPWNSAGSDGPIQLSDPTVRLNEDLRRPEDSPVLTYTPSDGEPTYLRTVALSNLTADGARLVPMRLSRFGLGGAYDYPGDDVRVEVQMRDVPSEYLPAPFAADGFSAEGTWSFDPDTMSIVAAGETRTEQTVNLRYSVDSTIPNPTKEQVEAAAVGTGVDPVNSEVPSGLSPEIEALTSEVVGSAETAGQKALAIQSYLRSDRFTYSLKAPTGTGSDVVSAFLLNDPEGYCIHFSAAMITMARMEGIPARMAIGFTPGERQEDGSYEVTTHDAHAWPELYLDGLGWVPFEPTPAFDGPPEYTDPAQQPSAPPSQTPTASAPPSAVPQQPTPTMTPPAQPEEGGEGPEGAGAVVIGIAALVLLLALPLIVRTVQRAVRLRSGQEPAALADGAWTEVRATLRDHGLRWSKASPGPASRELAEDLPDQAAAALSEVAHTVELSRFSRGDVDTDQLAAQVKLLRTSVARAAGTGTRIRALLLPRSVFTRHG